LAADPHRLATERAASRQTLVTAPLMDEARYVRAFEQLILEAVRLKA
jgi:hypothetical protein